MYFQFQPVIKYVPRLDNLQDIFMQKLQGVLKYHMQLVKEGFLTLFYAIVSWSFHFFSYAFRWIVSQK